MSEIKRYHILEGMGSKTVESETGYWIPFTYHEAALTAAQAERDAAIKEIGEIARKLGRAQFEREEAVRALKAVYANMFEGVPWRKENLKEIIEKAISAKEVEE